MPKMTDNLRRFAIVFKFVILGGGDTLIFDLTIGVLMSNS